MGYKSCENCGSKVYGGHCVYCHEETYIAEQNYSNDEPIAFSREFHDKLDTQAKEAKEIIDREVQEAETFKNNQNNN